MDKLWPTLLILVVVVLIFIGMWLGWRRLSRRDASLTVPSELAEPGDRLVAVRALHVATTHHDRPLDRVVVAGLAFRAAAEATVSTGGIVLAASGEPSVAITAASIVGIGAATWTIDRTVERDGLVLLAWRVADADGTVLDTYLRVVDPDQRDRFVDAARGIIPDAGPAGTATDETTGSEA